ncbi:MAG TPA: hypothetical protein VJ579_01705 [Candidatus Paceibacterota bacterium]|nr:hypothetical protein [Candidatus Paceibacterota bacterium]
MKIFQALGWGLFFLIVRNMMPEVFSSFTHSLTTFFHVLDIGLANAQSLNIGM